MFAPEPAAPDTPAGSANSATATPAASNEVHVRIGHSMKVSSGSVYSNLLLVDVERIQRRARGGRARVDPELAVDPLDVPHHRMAADPEVEGDPIVRAAAGEARKHLRLPRGDRQPACQVCRRDVRALLA